MPTGYTAAIAKDITFNDFVMQCAKAMLIMMRDEPANAPIPERFEPGSHYVNKITEANELLGVCAA